MLRNPFVELKQRIEEFRVAFVDFVELERSILRIAFPAGQEIAPQPDSIEGRLAELFNLYKFAGGDVWEKGISQKERVIDLTTTFIEVIYAQNTPLEFPSVVKTKPQRFGKIPPNDSEFIKAYLQYEYPRIPLPNESAETRWNSFGEMQYTAVNEIIPLPKDVFREIFDYAFEEIHVQCRSRTLNVDSDRFGDPDQMSQELRDKVMDAELTGFFGTNPYKPAEMKKIAIPELGPDPQKLAKWATDRQGRIKGSEWHKRNLTYIPKSIRPSPKDTDEQKEEKERQARFELYEYYANMRDMTVWTPPHILDAEAIYDSIEKSNDPHDADDMLVDDTESRPWSWIVRYPLRYRTSSGPEPGVFFGHLASWIKSNEMMNWGSIMEKNAFATLWADLKHAPKPEFRDLVSIVRSELKDPTLKFVKFVRPPNLAIDWDVLKDVYGVNIDSIARVSRETDPERHLFYTTYSQSKPWLGDWNRDSPDCFMYFISAKINPVKKIPMEYFIPVEFKWPYGERNPAEAVKKSVKAQKYLTYYPQIMKHSLICGVKFGFLLLCAPPSSKIPDKNSELFLYHVPQPKEGADRKTDTLRNFILWDYLAMLKAFIHRPHIPNLVSWPRRGWGMSSAAKENMEHLRSIDTYATD